ncbi:defect in organelle trafficking protein DotA [Legionella gratiana]|uniref:Defect in organelle trafficking protein DotA n=1 Tax=Legionella gratiana TaxID=45066 RepID=A0A378J1J7_9GAMM|nr:type IVB secretion system protein DotA [Legionella gratiana]KTD14649.1 defect in organelle trafficking protein DotA [Legionella gratiana]STX41613.1 defect in organelle trafficking protein DotA [Legionella gratiana]
MIKLAVSVLLFLFSGLVLAADGSLSFAPPASDYSVVFLGNLFGVVDGVLSGTGSQIMGSMFGVFNAAVLAIGGIVILYTLIVATMNTAHEGQMLGQKWSSIWIPIRATIGLALLIPKASGYCMMQIFVMWVVVQGVGAADKVWEAALSYLNRGGVIIQAQQSNPASQLTSSQGAGIGGIANGAETILAGQVCMLGLQTQLENVRQSYLSAKSGGDCKNATPGSPMDTFCKTPVPDFLSSVNAVAAQTTQQTAKPTPSSYSVKMPNFDSGPYTFLNGICGTLQWNSLATSYPKQFGGLTTNTSGINTGSANQGTGTNNTTISGKNGNQVTLNPSEVAMTQLSRAIAVQQMYTDLSSTARLIISNDPQMSSTGSSGTTPTPPWATQQFGIPYTTNGSACNETKNECVTWGPVPGTVVGGVLFNGTELTNAINSYNGVMMPTINLARMLTSQDNETSATNFINQASLQGWIMAGAYYYNLVQIQGASSISNASQIDQNTGLENSKFDPTVITSPFSGTSSSNCSSGKLPDQDLTNLCLWFNSSDTAVNNLVSLIGATSTMTKVPALATNMTLMTNNSASTVFGFLNNSLMMQTPGQPGTQPLTFGDSFTVQVNTTPVDLPSVSFSCGAVKPFFNICLGRIVGNVVYNGIIRFIYNIFIKTILQIIYPIIDAFLEIPLQGMAQIFQQGLYIIAQPGVNPVVALANMGSQYINFAGNLWVYLLGLAISSALIPIFGVFIFALLTLAMPLVIAWVGIMVGIGFITSYYVPILPYIIFVFAGIGWMIAVIEAMVAGPIIALGITHPEGHDAFGKGEAAIMLLLNVFLRPTMMIIGYISAIALSYVGVWLLNAGFDQAIAFVAQETNNGELLKGNILWNQMGGSKGFTDWTAIYAFFFAVLSYTMLYLTIIQKSFTLITYLPDKVLRWIGGTPESIGQESAQWGEEVKGKVQEAGKETQTAQGTMEKTMGGVAMKGVGKVKGALGKAFGGSGSTSGEGIQDGGEAGSSGDAKNPTPSSSSVESTQHAGAPAGASGPPPVSK